MTDPTSTGAQPEKRPYVAPALAVHGDVRALTLGKEGQSLDNDGGGSFVPDSGGATDLSQG